ncbi:unnamed protein product, partial [Ectocarpus sp. 12 AP-2014]
MVLTTAPVKVKITKDDETSELRRLAFGYDDSFQQASSGGLFDEQRQGYHLSLCKFLLRSLGGLYPDLPVGKFSELAVFTVKDEDGDMVRFDSEEEFVAAMSYKSWESCLRVEVTALKPSPSPPADDPEPAPVADATAAASSEEPAAIASSDPTPMSETASVMSFISNMSGSSSASAASSSSSSSSASVASEGSPPAVRSLATPVPAPAPPVDTAAAVEANDDDEEAMMAAAVAASIAEIAGDSSSSKEGNTNGNDINDDHNNNNNNNNNDTEQPVGSSSPPAAPAGFGGPGTPARAFLTQVLPGLADVLARSIYAAHRGSDGVPNTSPASALGGGGDSAAEKGIAAAAAAAAAAVAANAAATSAAAAAATAPEATATAQPSTEAAQAAAAAAAAAAGAAAGPSHTPGSNNGGRRTFAPGQGWRGRSNPQHGGWGEGRRKGHRWMRDLARRQQQQFERAASGMGPVPPGVEVVRGNGGDVGCNRQPWCGPRMQRRRDDDPAAPAPAAGARVVPNKDTLAAASAPISQQFPTPPVGVDEKSDADAEKAAVAADTAAAAAAAAADTAAASVEEPAEATAASAPALEKASPSPSPPPSGEYHDMLAASMRSLASSMTASFPASGSGSSTQEGGATAGKPSRNSGDTGGNKSSAKPMARFVTDVSVADGSPLPPNTRFVKTWCMRNDGPVTFPAGCKIVPVGGDLMAGPEDGVAVEQRGPGEEFHVS